MGVIVWKYRTAAYNVLYKSKLPLIPFHNSEKFSPDQSTFNIEVVA